MYLIDRTPTLVITEKRVSELLLVLSLKIILVYLYIYFVHKEFAYLSFPLYITSLKIFEGLLALLVLLFLLPKRETTPSTIGIKLLFIILIIPLTSFYWLTDSPRSYFYQAIIGFGITVYLVNNLPRYRLDEVLKIERLNKNWALILCLAIIIPVYLNLYIQNGPPNIHLILLDPSAVTEHRQQVEFGHQIMGYLVNWQARVISPFLLTIGIINRKYSIATVAILLNVLLYTYTSDTFYLLIPLLVMFTVIMYRKRVFFRFTLKSIIIGLIGLYFLYLYLGHYRLLGIFARRIFFVPARVQFEYYEFFSNPNNPYMFLGEVSFIPVSSPYSALSGELIRGEATWASSAYLGDAYMNIGFLGIILFSIIVGIVLVLVDSLSNKKNDLAIGTLIVPIFSLMNHGLTTTLLTGGLIFGILLIQIHRTS